MSDATADRVEVRLALILNGGVSLAVWMGGVTHEIDLLRRASANILPPDEGSPDRPVWEAWRDLCDRLAIVVKVDVVAGTSAGGLNGTFLATSIARGAPLPPLQEVWRNVAQIQADETDEHLLWPTTTDKASSVLNGPFFKRAVQRVLEGIPQGRSDSDITLFVTATALGKAPFGVLDKAGREFVIQDHRRLYRFAHNPRYRYVPSQDGTTTDADLDTLFAPETTGDAFADSVRLALGARASASFPAAFQPVRETNEMNELREHVTGESWLMDGGILNNAPFEPVINEVALRPADTPFKRALVYIVPEVDDGSVSSEVGAEPGWLRVLEATVNQPRESNLREDVDNLTAFARQADRWNSGPQTLFSEVLHDSKQLAECEAAARTLFAHYRASRIRGGVGDATRSWAQGRKSIPVTMPDAALVTVTPDGWVPADFSEATIDQTWHWGTAVADRVLRVMLRDLLSESTDATQAAPRQSALTVLSRQLQYAAAVRGSVNKMIQTSLTSPDPNLVAAALNVANAEQAAPRVLARIVTAGAEAYCEAVKGDVGGTLDAQDVIRAALVIEILMHAFTADEPFARAGRFDFFRFGPDIDSPTVRVPDPDNPPDIRRSGAWKLWGSQLGHFAAFGRPEWRDQDWAWGRLDGIGHLVKLLEVERSVDLSDDLVTIQGLALQAQRLTCESLQAGTAELVGLGAADVVKLWGVPPGDVALVEALDSAIRTLSDKEHGNNTFVADVGVGLGKLLGSHAVPTHQVGRILRLMRWHHRFAIVRDRIRAAFRGDA